MTVPNPAKFLTKSSQKSAKNLFGKSFKKFTQNLKISTFIENFQNQILFGKLLKKVCKKNQLVCRWGGEEFLILMKHATQEDAEQMCHRIQQRMAQQLFSHQKTLTCSFGIAQLRPDESLMACFERADQMLYQAKKHGRNRVCKAS